MTDLLRKATSGQPPNSPRSRAHRAWMLAEGDAFLAQYFQRIDLRVAATFTPEQRVALKQMFGDNHQGRHLLDFRHSLPFGRRRFYLVLLLGHERRALERLRAEGVVSRTTSVLLYLLAAAILAVPLLTIAYVIELLAGVDLAVGGGMQRLWDALRELLGPLLGG